MMSRFRSDRKDELCLILDEMGEWNWSTLDIQVSNALPQAVLAYTQGACITISGKLLREALAGETACSRGLFIFLHEIVHVWQQSVLSLSYPTKELRAYIASNRLRLEKEADELACKILDSEKKVLFFQLFFGKRTGRTLYHSAEAPIQAWCVDGWESVAMMQLKVPMKKMRKYGEIYSHEPQVILNAHSDPVQIYKNQLERKGELLGTLSADGVHEVFTRDGAKSVQAIWKRGGKGVNPLSDNAIEWLVHGSQFNDRGPYGNVMFAIKFSTGDLTYRVDENNQWCGMGRARNYYCGNGENTREKAIWGDEFINQTHLGEMQFLHSMATSGGDYQFDKEKILRWMEFGVDIYNQKPIHLQDAAGNSYVKDIVDCTWEEYYGTLDDQDVMLTMVGAMLVDSVQLKKWTESRPKDSGEQIKTQQLARARSLREALRSADKKFYSPYYHMTIRDFFVDKDYGEKYGGEDICQIARFVALGTVCHMIQDSFANSHSKRAYDLFCKTSEGMELEPDTLCESNIVTVSTLPEYKRQEKIRNYLRNNVPTILLFADYAEQDGSRHAYADVWCATYEVTGNHDMSYYYKNTRNADYARDCTAAFLYMVLARCKPSEIRSFVSGIYPLQPAASDFAPTKAGYQYEKVESDVGVLGKYAIDILKTVGYNNIVSSKERLDVLYTHVMYLDDILTPKTVKHKKRRKHGRRYYNRRPKTLKQKKNDEKSACLKYRETYVRHLNEIVMELYVFACQVTGGNTKKANKNEIETSKIQIDDLLLCAQEIYEDMDREVHPFIQKARSILTPTMISE